MPLKNQVWTQISLMQVTFDFFKMHKNFDSDEFQLPNADYLDAI